MIAASKVMMSPYRPTTAGMLTLAEKLDDVRQVLTHLNGALSQQNRLIVAVGVNIPDLIQLIDPATERAKVQILESVMEDGFVSAGDENYGALQPYMLYDSHSDNQQASEQN